MAIEIVATICFGLAAGGVVLLIFKVLKVRAAAVIAVTCAGVAMIAFTAWNRYHWAGRIKASLPENVHVVREVPSKSFLDPWSFAMPLTGSLVALDEGQTLRHPDLPGRVIVTLLQIEPYSNPVSLAVLVDCTNQRFAPLNGTSTFHDGKLPDDLAWRTPDANTDLLMDRVCGSGDGTTTQLSAP